MSQNTARLRFSPSILRRLGEELNPHLDQGVLELVKNAYDADARHCVVEVVNADKAGGTLRITDDGVGMDVAGIENGWLLLGESNKQASRLTELGRSPVGNKGLGRLAALRMGRSVRLVTRPQGGISHEHVLVIEWERFDRVRSVDEVALTIQSRLCIPPSPPGTEIEIEGLRESLTHTDVKRLARGLLLLADPFGDNPTGFQPILRAPEFEDLERLVRERYFEDAEFHLIANVDRSGRAQASVLDWRGQVLYRAAHTDLRRSASPYHCPNAQFDLWVFILNKRSFAERTTTVQEVQNWLREFGGVHLYVRGIRVAPYGNPGSDWLDMNLRRVQHPELRPSTNTSIGRVMVSDHDGVMLQKTDRSGMVEGEAFHHLRLFAQDALDWMARQRLAERENRRTTEKRTTHQGVARARSELQDIVRVLPEQTQVEMRMALNNYDRAREQEGDALRNELQVYRTLITLGITAATFAHELRQPVKVILKSVEQLSRRMKATLGDTYAERMGNQVERIIRQSHLLQSFGNMFLGFLDREKRRAGRVEVYPMIAAVIAAFQPSFEERQVHLIVELTPGQPYLKGTRAALESILINLIVNSLKAFELAADTERCLTLSTRLETRPKGPWLVLTVTDNGPGIDTDKIALEDIWLPGESTYPNGTGLGLTIVRDTIHDLGGTIDARAKGEKGGAEFILQLPLLGVEP